MNLQKRVLNRFCFSKGTSTLQRFSKHFSQEKASKHKRKPRFSGRAEMFVNKSCTRLLETLCQGGTDSEVMEGLNALQILQQFNVF